MKTRPLFRRFSTAPVRPFAAALACVVGLTLAGSLTHAADLPPPNTLLLSGKLKQANAPSQGEHDFRFQLYNSETGGQIPPGTKDVLMTKQVTAGDWQVALDVSQFGAEAAILDNTVHDGTGVIVPPQSYVGILDNTVRPPQGWVSILDNTVRPPMGSRSILHNTFHTATALNWRAAQGTWLQISVRKKGTGAFVPLTPRQRLTAVPGAVVAQTANHALVAGTVSEGGVDSRALAPGAITAEKLSVGAINNDALANLAVTAPKIANATVVRSLNGLQDDVTLAAGTGVTLSKSGNTLVINSTATGGGGGGGGTPLPNGNFLGVNNDNVFGGGASFGVIGGGQSTKISDNNAYSTLGGGQLSRIYERANWSFLGGGYDNFIDRDSSHGFLGGGRGNHIGTNSLLNVLVGGDGNVVGANSSDSFIGGGQLNRIGDGSNWSGVASGYNNAVADNVANTIIGGGYSNNARGGNSITIAGGNQNTVEGSFGTVGGGGSNFAGPDGTVAGGGGNRASGTHSTIGGGVGNSALTDQSVIGGGVNNTVHNSLDGTIGGGGGNKMTNSAHGTISGGDANTMLDGFGTVIAGGLGNVAASQASAILGGEGNRVEGTQGYATVLGGSLNLASGTHSLAAGRRAEARHHGSLVWNSWPGRSDSTPFVSERDGEFAARAYGGFRLITEGTEPGVGDIRLDAGNAVLLASGRTASLRFGQSFNLTAGGGVNFTTGGQGLFVDGQKVGTGGGVGGGVANGPINVITGGGQTEPQARLEQTNPNDYVRMFMNTPKSFWTIGTGPEGWFGFYVPGQSPANTTGDNGAHRFLITANGEVGVGSEKPLAQFHVRGGGGFDLPQGRFTQKNPQDFARLRLETGQQSWDMAAGPDGSLRFFSRGSDRLILGTDGVQLTTGASGLIVNGRTVAFADQLGQGGQGGNGGAVSATVTQGSAITATSQDTQAGIAVNATGRVGIRATSSSPQGAAVQAIQLNGSGYAGDFAGKVKVSSTLEANGGLKVGGQIHVAGLGDNTPTAAFRLEPDILPLFAALRPGDITTLYAIIDHPMLNGNPNALLLLTPVNSSAFKLYQRNSDTMRGDFLTYFPDVPASQESLRGRWVIDITRPPPGLGQPQTSSFAIFNALVVAP